MVKKDDAPATEKPAPRRHRGEGDAPSLPGTPGAPGPVSSPPSLMTGGLALILAVLALLGSVWTWHTVTTQQGIQASDTLKRLEQIEAATKRSEELQPEIERRLTALKETQDALKAGVEKIYNDIGKGRAEWLVYETEQLLLIANHRLQLAREAGLALAALRAADRQLKLVANPALLPVRRLLAEEIAALATLERTDIPGMTLKLSGIVTRVDRLPLAGGPKPAGAPKAPARAEKGGGVGAFVHEMWSDFISLIRIRHSSEAVRPLLPPEQRFFLRENLRLNLLGAQLALLHGDAATFEANLRMANDWLRTHFDAGSPQVTSIVGDLDQMLQARLNVPLPDISRSLEALRKITGRPAP